MTIAFSGDTDIGANAKSDGSDLRVSIDGGMSFLTGQLQYYTAPGGAASGQYVAKYSPVHGSPPTVQLWYDNPSATNADSTAAWDGKYGIYAQFCQQRWILTGSEVSPRRQAVQLNYRRTMVRLRTDCAEQRNDSCIR